MNDAHHQDITEKYRELAVFAAGIIPHKLPLEPTRGDVMATVDDLRLLARKVDAIVEAYALYVTHHTGHRIDADYAADQLSRALDGNLLYEIEMAADEAVARLVDNAA